MKITVTTTGVPPLESAEAIAIWMAQVLNKVPDLKLVKPPAADAGSQSPQRGGKRG